MRELEEKQANLRDLIESYHNLASLYEEQGKLEEAITFYLSALDLHEKVFGTESLNLVPRLNNVGMAYKKLKNYDTAIKYFVRSLEIKKKKYGESHDELKDAYGNLKGICDLWGKHDLANVYEELSKK